MFIKYKHRYEIDRLVDHRHMVSLECRKQNDDRRGLLNKKGLLLIEDYLREIAPSRRTRDSDDFAVIYARFSSRHQKTDSIFIQSDKGVAYAGKHGFQLRPGQHLYADNAVSGHDLTDRPQLEALRKLAREGGFKKLLIKGVDRLSRRQWQAYMLLEEFAYLGVEVHITGDVSHGLLDSTRAFIDGFIAMRDREKILTDTKNGLVNAAWDGRNVATIPYGYKRGRTGEMVVDPKTAPIVTRIFEDYAKGLTHKKIARMLNIEGVPSPSGKKWSAAAIFGSWLNGSGSLRNIKYIGIAHYNRTGKLRDPSTGRDTWYLKPRSEWILVSKPEWRIVSDDLWKRVAGRLRKSAAETAAKKQKLVATGPSARVKASRERHSEKSTSLFHGRYFCKCGAPMHATFKDSNSRQLICADAYASDLCSRRVSTLSNYVEIEILREIRDSVTSNEAVQIFKETYSDSIAEESDRIEQRRDILEKDIAVIEKRIDRLIAQALDDDGLSEDYERNYNRYKFERDDKRAELTSLRMPTAIPAFTIESVAEFRQQVDGLIVQIPFVEKTREDMELVATLRALVCRVELDRPDKHEGYTLKIETTLSGLGPAPVSGGAKIDHASGTGPSMPRSYEPPMTTLVRKCTAPRMRRSIPIELSQHLESLAASGCYATTDDDWLVAAPLLSDFKIKDRRNVLDAAIFCIRTQRGITCLPAPYEKRSFAERVRAIFAEGWFSRVISALEATDSPTVAGLDRTRIAILIKRLASYGRTATPATGPTPKSTSRARNEPRVSKSPVRSTMKAKRNTIDTEHEMLLGSIR